MVPALYADDEKEQIIGQVLYYQINENINIVQVINT